MPFPSLTIGIDIIEIERICKATARWQNRFLQRIFTRNELHDCQSHWDSLAARFAAKEAVLKALGTGKGIAWHDIEIRQLDNDAPYICLHGNANRLAIQKGIKNFAISLSHSDKFAIAVTIANV